LRGLSEEQKPIQSWSTARAFADQCDYLLQRNTEGWNLYAGVAPRRKEGGSKAADVAILRVLYADLDHCTVEQALARVDAAPIPRPTMVVDSGHGVHFYWRLRNPFVGQALVTVRHDLEALALLLGGD